MGSHFFSYLGIYGECEEERTKSKNNEVIYNFALQKGEEMRMKGNK
jgi:hypothetical protein